MELTVPKKDLLRLVGRMQSVAERKSTMAALSNVLVAVEGPNVLRLSATDLYLGVSGKLNADIRGSGSVAIPAKEFFERLKMMPEGPVHLTTQDNASVIMKAGTSPRRFSLRGMPGKDFPALPTPMEGAPSLALEVGVLLNLINKTHFSISTDETRAHLNSALFEWEGDTVRMVTTDGHRLTKMEVQVTDRQATATMLIPLKAIQELRRHCEDMISDAAASGGRGLESPKIEIAQNASNAFFLTGSTTFSVKLIDAQFPPYGQVIPKNAEKRVRASRKLFADSLRAVSIAASEKTGGVRFSLTHDLLKISSESPESGEGVDEVPVDYNGPPMTLGFNARYFLDVLGALDDEEVLLEFSGELDPATVRPVTEDGFLGVIMPMRI